jgi:hypothetical protein
MECHEEVRTGTSLPRKVCRSQIERDNDKNFARELILTPTARPGAQ